MVSLLRSVLDSWYYFGTREWQDTLEFSPDGTEILPWVERRFGRHPNATVDMSSHYATAVYWAMMTVTAVVR